MNEMYKYLEEHNYISKNENKDPLRQQELSITRAECIANKYDSLIDELQRENQLLRIQISAREEVCNRLESNWNKLKEMIKSKSELKQKCHSGFVWIEIGSLLDKMQELGRNDNNE